MIQNVMGQWWARATERGFWRKLRPNKRKTEKQWNGKTKVYKWKGLQFSLLEVTLSTRVLEQKTVG